MKTFTLITATLVAVVGLAGCGSETSAGQASQISSYRLDVGSGGPPSTTVTSEHYTVTGTTVSVVEKSLSQGQTVASTGAPQTWELGADRRDRAEALVRASLGESKDRALPCQDAAPVALTVTFSDHHTEQAEGQLCKPESNLQKLYGVLKR